MFYETELGKIYYEIYGQEGKPFVVLTHGLGMNLSTFDAQINKLSDEYRVLVWDLPGHGQSFEIGHGDGFSFFLAAECLLGLLNELNVKKAILVGQSLGGMVSQYIAHHYPERVSAVVDIGSIPLHKGLNNRHDKLFRFFFPLFRLVPAKILSIWFARQKSVNKETRRYLKEVTGKTGKKQILDLTKSMLICIDEGIKSPITHSLLIIHGDREQKYIIKSAEKWHEEVPMSEYAVIPNAGHIANQDNPVEFNRLLLSFLKKLKMH